MPRLEGKRIAIVATDGFEEAELFEPRNSLLASGAHVEIVSPKSGEIQGFHIFDKAKAIAVDKAIGRVKASDYSALLLPGGTINSDMLRADEAVLDFVRGFFAAGKPVAALCHAPWVFINAGVAKGRTLTSYPTIRKDLENAGAVWVDREAVVDRGLVTSRDPRDIPALMRKWSRNSARAGTRCKHDRCTDPA